MANYKRCPVRIAVACRPGAKTRFPDLLAGGQHMLDNPGATDQNRENIHVFGRHGLPVDTTIQGEDP
jgi:hypothetical protein